MIKLVYPDGRWTREELTEVATLASELRQRVHNQLVELAPGEFKPRFIGLEGVPAHKARDLRAPGRTVLPEEDRLNREAVVGAATGLSVLTRDGVSVGAELILVQVSAFSGYARLDVMGLHGQVLRDSVQTAYNIVRTRYREFGINENLLREPRGGGASRAHGGAEGGAIGGFGVRRRHCVRLDRSPGQARMCDDRRSNSIRGG